MEIKKINIEPGYHFSLKRKYDKKIEKDIAVFGGSFDPPTISHLIVACEIYNNFEFIDEVWIVPCGDGREDKKLRTSIDHRINMLECIKNDLAYSDLPIYIKSTEKENGKFMPTFDLLERLKSQNSTYNFYFCFGSDLANSLPRWEFGEKIISDYGLILIQRPGYETKGIPYLDKCSILTSNLDFSSTIIRNRIENFMTKKNRVHLGISGMTTKSVIDYIYKNGLYKVDITDKEIF